jgi:hypothetical protein
MGSFISHRMFVAALNGAEPPHTAPETERETRLLNRGPVRSKSRPPVSAPPNQPWFDLRVAREMLRPSC